MENPITVPYKNNTTKFHAPNWKPFKKISFGGNKKQRKTKTINPLGQMIKNKVLGSVFGRNVMAKPVLTKKGIIKKIKSKIGLEKPKKPQIMKNATHLANRLNSFRNIGKELL